jgi:hypothetical protein
MKKTNSNRVTGYLRMDILDLTPVFSYPIDSEDSQVKSNERHNDLCSLIDDALARIEGFKDSIKGIVVHTSDGKIDDAPRNCHLNFYCWVSGTQGLLVSRGCNGGYHVYHVDATEHTRNNYVQTSQLDAKARKYTIPENLRLWD